MNKPHSAALAAVLLSGPALGSVSLSVQVWNGGSWGSSLGTDGASIPRIQFGVFGSFTGAQGLAAAQYNIVGSESRQLFAIDRSIDIASAGLGRQAPFTVAPNAAATFFSSSPSGWRIDDAGDAANSPGLGIQSAQQGPAFNPANPILLYRFDLVPSPMLTGVTVTVVPSEAINAMVFPTGGGPAQATTIGTLSGASVTFIPAPTGCGLAIIAMTTAGLRRRRAAIAT